MKGTNQMMRNLKALGLALVAVLAMGAMAAASAQAAPEFTLFDTALNKDVSGKITGSASTTQIFKSTAATELALECTEATGEATSGTGSDASLTFTNIVYQGGHGTGTCKTNPLGLPVHVFMNGCHFEFTVTKTITENKEYEGEVHIKCTGETKHITVEVTNSSNMTKCTITIGEQTVGPVVYKNTTVSPGPPPHTDVSVISKAKNVVNTTAGGLLGCGVANGEHKEGVYEGSVTGKGENTVGETVDATVRGK